MPRALAAYAFGKTERTRFTIRTREQRQQEQDNTGPPDGATELHQLATISGGLWQRQLSPLMPISRTGVARDRHFRPMWPRATACGPARASITRRGAAIRSANVHLFARANMLLSPVFCRGVAQPGRASALGAEGRVFESCRPDQVFRSIERALQALSRSTLTCR